ncbi:RagB/SusD family nutrient uptake outer membrane protein [Hymenobacter cellulosivorans]|uniref:RagB/SusD family nutrient uptake outer membrane protein n=1 Tax=Hymenobacter cellulosivorans TaxID=2932249 RepID=A0ABY4F9U7_9BACT|nr:RagB/SusD family nutrient uptake outer membrane protein [Hymenobacter cellulosivorans]UOQ52724.1 RagB/SusD family nutrient uptake outer membrane protein [Hymenobacter cellulosivorans]
MKASFLTRLGLASVLLLSATACEKDILNQVNPNLPTSEGSFKTSDDAVRAANACYAGLQGLGMYRRWLNFAFDLRDDTGFSQSPWGELADFTHFIQTNYDFEVSNNIWRDHYRTIYRCNQVLGKVPSIQGMDATLQKRVLAEARFLRALCYFNLVSLYGNVPLVLATATDLNTVPPQGNEAQVWSQVISDLQAAQADLPVSYTGNDIGRATKGAATTLLGKAYMQNKRWADAQAQFAQVISSGRYQLAANYTDNFRHTTENNSESIFEVQFTDEKKGGNDAGNGPDATSSQGGQRSQFWGVPGYGFNDGEVRPWVVREFLQEPTATGQRDPRLAATVFYNRKDQTQFPTALASDADTLVYGVGFLTRYGNEARNRSRVYWRKYQTDYYRTFEDFDSPINHRVMRYADVLLLQAEAMNEQNNPAMAIPLVNQVRQRAGLAPLPGTLSREALRTQLMHERVTELTGEGVRWFDLQRWDLLTDAAKVNELKARDPDFNNFIVGKSRLLPLLQTEVDLNRLQQNSQW